MWAFKTLHDKGLVYEGFRVLAYCWRCETPLSNTETADGRRLPRPPGPGADRVRSSWTTGEKIAASGPPRRGRCRRTWRSPSARTSTTRCCEEDGQRYILGDVARRPPTRRSWPAPTRVGTVTGARAGRAPVHAAVRLPRRQAARTPSRCSARTSSPPRTAPASCTWRPPSARTTRPPATPPASRPSSPWTSTPGSPSLVPAVPGHAGLRGQQAGHPRPQGRAAWCVRHDTLHPLLPALLALRHAAGLQGGVVVVRGGDHVPGPDGRAQPADQLDAGAHQGRLVRQVAGQRPRLVDQPEPVLGLADPGVEVRRPAVPAGRRVRLARRARARLRRARSTDLHRPDGRRADPAQPGRPDRAVRSCAGCRRCSTAGSSPGSMPFAQVHYPFENADWFEHHYPGDFIVEYIGQTRGWFYTMHVLATALFDRPAFRNCVSHGILLGDDGRKMSKSLRNYPDVYRVFDDVRLRRDALDPDVVAGAARRRHAGHRGGDPRRGPAGAAAAVERLVLLLALRQRRRLRRRRPAHRLARTCSTGTCWPRPASWSPTCSAQMDAYDISGACATVRSYLDALTNWYVRRSRDRFWAGDRGRVRHAATPCWRRSCRVRRAARAADRGGDLARPDRRAVGAPDRLAGRRRSSRPTTTLVADMDAVRDVCSAALSLRKARGLRVRLPLPTLTVATPARGRAARRSPTWSPTRSTSRRSCSPTTWPRTATQVLTRGAAGARPAPRQAGPAGDQGGQGRRLAAASTARRWPAGSRCRTASTS